MDIKKAVAGLPQSPGVYLMKGERGEVLYVGKAKDLKKRVSSYFVSADRHTERTRQLVSRIREISHIRTATESEAFIYENSLIKQFSPKYNVALKDGKTYPLLKLSVQEEYPRLTMTRQKKADGSAYFGPYANAKLLREAIIFLKRLFPLRSCSRMPKGVCLEFHIRQCLAPCVGKIDSKRYRELVLELKTFLEKGRSELITTLTEKMDALSKRQDYEQAAGIRDRIVALATLREDRVRYSPFEESEELRSVLGISGAINTIEAFDISNTMGAEAVGSMVIFIKGRPYKDGYRKFAIKTVGGIDDYGMIREVVRRRYMHVVEGGLSQPDLILIDGGRGHLNAATEVARSLGLGEIPMIGLAKEFEHIYTRVGKDPIVLPKESKALHLLKRVRDEAHRFALAYHIHRRSRSHAVSALDAIPGIGAFRRKALIAHFGSVGRIRTATLEEFYKIRSIDEKTARRIVDHFKRPEADLL